MSDYMSHNLGLELVRITEMTALVAGHWTGSGDREGVHRAATLAMAGAFQTVDIDGYIVIGEEGRVGENSPLDTNQQIGMGSGPKVDVVLDPIDGTRSVVRGRPGAVSVAAIAPYGSIWSPQPAVYMDKIIVDEEVAEHLIPECMDAPVGWTLALIAKAKGKAIRDLRVVILDRPRHQDVINEIRQTGAKIMLRPDGDTTGAMVSAHPGFRADILLGIGGASEAVAAACVVKAMGGGMLTRLAPQSEAERNAVIEAGLDTNRILTSNELITSDKIFFAATGVTYSLLLDNVAYHGKKAKTHSIVVRGETGTIRHIHSEFNNVDALFKADNVIQS